MHGQKGHGILLLQDLEDDDQDAEFQTGYHINPDPSPFIFHKDKPATVHNDNQLLQVPSQSHSLYPQVLNNHSYNNAAAYQRRKSVSADPPWNINSTTSGITVAPTRNSLLEANVFTGGRGTPSSSNQYHHHHHKKHNNFHRKHHKGRHLPKSEPGSDAGGGGGGAGGGSILDRIDNSIMKKFGDWSTIEEEGKSKLANIGNGDFRSNNTNSKHVVPYYIPKRMGSFESDNSNQSSSNGNGLAGLPKLFKDYDSVVTNSKQVLTDKTYKIALSKDNNDPNSILSEAKRTLSRFGGGND